MGQKTRLVVTTACVTSRSPSKSEEFSVRLADSLPSLLKKLRIETAGQRSHLVEKIWEENRLLNDFCVMVDGKHEIKYSEPSLQLSSTTISQFAGENSRNANWTANSHVHTSIWQCTQVQWRVSTFDEDRRWSRKITENWVLQCHHLRLGTLGTTLLHCLFCLYF